MILFVDGDLLLKLKFEREILESCHFWKHVSPSSEPDAQSPSARLIRFRLISWPEPVEPRVRKV